jgi:hypothetical protein
MATLPGKIYLWKLYDSAGTFITTWEDVISEPVFSREINGGYSDLVVQLARSIYNFGEGEDVAYGNQLKLFVFDRETGDAGVCIYSGFISLYNPDSQGSKEIVEVTFLGYWTESNQYILKGDGSGIDSPIYGAAYNNNIVATMTSNTAPSGVASASSESSASYKAWQAFDGNIESSVRYDWCTANAQASAWLKYDFGAGNAKTLQKYAITGIGNGLYANRFQTPKNWTFEGSNNDSTWVVLDTRVGEQDWAEAEKRVYTFINITAYRYYRINISAQNGDSGGAFRLMELEMMEATAYSRTGSTAISYMAQSPKAIINDILSKFNSAGGRLSLGTSDDPGTSVSYQFNSNTVQESIMQALLMCPYDYYARIDSDDKLYIKQKSATALHTFHVGRMISNYKQEKRTENIINAVYFTGGGDPKIFKEYLAAGSISAYGMHATKIVNERITNLTAADAMANRQLNLFAAPEIRITVDVIDSNNAEDGQGYDIESIKPGDTCKILGATSKGANLWDEMMWDVDSWDFNITNAAASVLQIMKVTYKPGVVTLEISNRQPDLTQRIQQIDNNLVNSQTVDNPVIPLT